MGCRGMTSLPHRRLLTFVATGSVATALAAAPTEAWQGRSGGFKITSATTNSTAWKPIVVLVTGRVTKAKVTGSFKARYQRASTGTNCSYGPDPFVAKRLARVPAH